MPTTLSRAVAAALVLAVAMLAAPATAEAADRRPFFYNLTTDDVWTAGMALAQANTAAGRGHAVTVFLNVRAVRLANANAKQGSFGPTGRTAAEMLGALMAKGQTVLVCGLCMQVEGVTAEALIEGAAVSNADLVFEALTAPDTIVMGY